MKQYSLPSADEVRAALRPLPTVALKRLSVLSTVSVHTLLKIRDGAIADPGVNSVALFWPHLEVIHHVFVDGAQPPAEPAPKRRGRPPGRSNSAPASSLA
jgi:hypothetical protein